MTAGDGRVGVLVVARGNGALGSVRDSELMFPHPRPLPHGGVLGVWRGGFRGRGGTAEAGWGLCLGASAVRAVGAFLVSAFCQSLLHGGLF
jgi:hypothetical protein